MVGESSLSPRDIEKLKTYLAALPDEGAVYGALGTSLGPAASGEEPEARGRRALARRIQDLRTSICGNSALKAFSTSDNAADATELALAVAGVLASVKFAGLDPLLVACLVGRIGLRRVCSDQWT